ncbi:MAG: orotidine 5'-phosphate decarboxylase [Planctomycetes bacterium]|nr:orotidine 5'-phosphate decarboxylase [Planctomycetota bacterium]
MPARLQVALDFVVLTRALRAAREAVEGGADILEAGTPLIKSEGLEAVRRLHAEFPDHPIVADLKTMDAGRIEMEMAAKSGARIAMVLGAASDATIRECAEVGKNYGLEIGVDMVRVADPVERAKEVSEFGIHLIGIHCPIDDQMRGLDPFETARKVAAAVDVPIAVAGGINSETAADAVAAGASIVIVGGAITKSENAREATERIKRAMETGEKIETRLFKRHTAENLRPLLAQISSANLSDAMHRSGDIQGIRPVYPQTRVVGPAVTVRTYPGDWAKPVEAIEHCQPGDVLVIDAGGIYPAVWGELASHSAQQRKISGAVVYGGVRDVDDIRRIGFPCYASVITPTAGEPKGFGEINVPIRVGGVLVEPGDWIVGDDSGVVRVPRAKAVEVANRGMDVLEQENRLRKEILESRTLSEVAELLRWEKR